MLAGQKDSSRNIMFVNGLLSLSDNKPLTNIYIGGNIGM